jgi:4-amino-4-deoxy-L-arabinose transferase-like glycosyltransferase
MRSVRSSIAVAAAIALLLLAAALLAWPIIPIDETRYVGVAWEMWLRGDFLVPHLNGEEYSHKPPLLFWLIDLGWWLFGVNDWWPRVVPTLFALASAALLAHIARLLWPDDRRAALAAPVLLVGSGLWMVVTPVIMFDLMVAFFALVAIAGVLHAWRGRWAGWLLCGAGIGFGVLAKGPVVLLHVAPAVVLAPYWMRERRPASWARWFGGFGIAFLVGAAIALAWALSAAHRASDAYGHAIFWGQTANRVVHSFAHARPLYWYLPFVPLMLLPWLVWPRAWRSLGALRRAAAESGVRLCTAWPLALFAMFSLMSGKQVHYLLPVVPAVMLLVARALSVGFAAGGGARDPLSTLPKIAFPAAAFVALAMAAGFHSRPAEGQDLGPMAQRLAALERANVPVAHVGTYQDQYQFTGRLERPLTVLHWKDVPAWLEAHPGGRVVVYFRDTTYEKVHLEYLQRYRGQRVGIAAREAALALAAHGGSSANDEAQQ